MVKRALAAAMLLLLAACQTQPVVPTPIGTVTRPDLVNLINWERAPLAVVFRAETASSDSTSFARRTDIADCTIYGDNRVVYIAPADIGYDANWQRVSDEAIRLFIEDLTVNYKFYSEQSGVDALAPEERPDQVETLTLVVNGQAHRADALGTWSQTYYTDVLERCRAVADSPALLVPSAAYLSVMPVQYNEYVPSMSWNADSGIDLSTLSDQRIWVTSPALKMLWEAQRNAGIDIQFEQGDAVYQVAIEIPGVSRYAPPPP